MMDYRLKITLLSDATFGRGDGVAGLVDAEVQHDAAGLPYLGGRALKGLLGAECADILFALGRARPEQAGRWQVAASRLFGDSGAGLQGQGILKVGPARLPEDLRAVVAHEVSKERYGRSDVLGMLTALRRQTAMDATTGAPKRKTLRTMRVILHGTPFEAALHFAEEPAPDDLALLAACVRAFRRAGTGRNRGRGRLEAALCDPAGQDVTAAHWADWRKAVLP